VDSILWCLVIAVHADQLVRFFNILCPQYTQARIKIIREKFNLEKAWHLLCWSYFACVKVWASEIARTTQEKPAFENNDIGSQQKFLVSTGYQMNVLYSPHWWPHDCFSVPTGDQMNIFFSVPTGDQMTMAGDRQPSFFSHHWQPGDYGFSSLVHTFHSQYLCPDRRQKQFCEWWSTVYSKCLISDKQNRKVGVAETLYTYKYCLLGCDAMPSAKHHFHKLHTIFPSWATLAINMEAAQHDFLVYSSCAPDVMLS